MVAESMNIPKIMLCKRCKIMMYIEPIKQKIDVPIGLPHLDRRSYF